MTILLISIPGLPPREMTLEGGSYHIGRGAENEIVLESKVISRVHGLLEQRGAEWIYTDLKSSNHSFVNGKEITDVVLRNGMQLQLGKDPRLAVMITARLDEQAAGAEDNATRIDATMVSVARPNSTLVMERGASPGRGAETQNIQVVPEFIVRDADGATQKYTLSKPIMRLGRAVDNDIVVNSRLVSKNHLQVETKSGKVAITDLNSTNGTHVNGNRIAPNQSIALKPGDVMRIGDLTGNSIQITYGSGIEGDARRESVDTLDLSKLVTQPSMIVGRDDSCDLTMPHPGVSKHHAMITRENGQISIRDLGSTNGTFVNGARITQVVLNNGDEIRIGPFHLVYDGARQNLGGSRRLGHRLDAIHLVKQVKGGFTILKDVSLSIQPTEFVAFVGGSGAGKSTLMKAFNGYEPATKGQLLIDGEELYSRLDMYRTEMGYVPQDDIIHRELPVRLALWYAAKLRLPDASKEEIEKSIDDALKAVEMTEHQTKRVKDLSGGQRKRVSIAAELLAQPSLFYLDEPTSGLDPGLEKKMMYDLKRLADQGRTILLVTHATANIEQCDYVAFMANGQLAYYGPPKEAIKFFEAEDFSDIYQKLSFEIDPSKGASAPPELQAEYQQAGGKVSAGVLWSKKFHSSPLYQKYVASRQASISDSRKRGSGGGSGSLRPARASFFKQTYYLARRHFDLIRHDVRTLIILLAMMPMIGVLFGAVSGHAWLTGKEWETKSGTVITANIKDAMKADLKGEPKDASNTFTPYQDASTLVMMLALALTQGGTFAASYEIVKERAIFRRERAVNLSVWSYVLSKVVVLGLFALIQVGATLLMLSFFVDLNVTGIVFTDFSILEIFISLYMAVLASIGLGLFISALVPSTDVVLYVILAQLFLQIVLTGTLFPLDSNPASYAVPGYWATDALSSIVDLPRLDKEGWSCQVAEGQNTTTGAMELQTFCDSAESKATSLKNYAHTAEHMLFSWFAMGAQMLFFVLLTIFVQARKKPERD